MEITIHPTVPAEAELLASIQREAFRPLYEKYHDPGNPYLRGAEDVLRRLNGDHRYYTVCLDGTVVGGIFYRLRGTRPPGVPLGEGEYYLCRLYVHPSVQGKGIAGTAIRLCESEFPDATVYHLDFPVDMEKNRRCYEKAGFRDTGEILRLEGAPPLAVYEKRVAHPPSPASNAGL